MSTIILRTVENKP